MLGHAVIGDMMSPVEDAPPVLSEGSEPDVFPRLVPPGVPVVAAAALSGSELNQPDALNNAPVKCGVSTMVFDASRYVPT